MATEKSSVLPSTQADLQPAQKQPALTARWMQTINPKNADLICLVLCLITGLHDSAAYNAWSCFLAMQTGNTIFLGLGASNQPTNKPFGWLKSLVSIISFFLGSFVFANVTRRAGSRARGTLLASTLVQTVFIIIAASVIQADLIPHTPADAALSGGPLFLELIPIALLAFQAAGSITTSRALGYAEIPAVVLTSVYFDIGSDPTLGAALPANSKRNRRVSGAVMLLVGAIAGGWLSRSSGGMMSALWMAAGLKFCIAVAWWFWPVDGKVAEMG